VVSAHRDFSLRPGRVEDLPAILRHERDYVRAIEPESADGWVEAVDRNLALWIDCLPTTVVLELPGSSDPDPAGYVMWLAEGSTATLVSIQVGAAHRRAGFGRALLRAFEQQAASSGAAMLKLGVHRQNPARALYEREGYVVAGQDGDYVLLEREPG
jgi:GNAT superfamily N-acetyltransferase